MTRFYGMGLPHVHPETLKGKLIAVDGPDGSGCSTQVALLREWLEELGYAAVVVGRERTALVGKDLQRLPRAKGVNPITLALFSATDFADRLEKTIVPALRSGFVVIADRYVYSLMARAIVRGADAAWVRDVYGIALEPDVAFYLKTAPQVLADRHIQQKGMLDPRETGPDAARSGKAYESFIRYQRSMGRVLQSLARTYRFEIVGANLAPETIARRIRTRMGALLNVTEAVPGRT